MKPHHALKQYRVYSVAIVLFFMYVTLRLLDFLEAHHATMTEAAAAGVISLALAVVGAIVKALEVFNRKAEQDD